MYVRMSDLLQSNSNCFEKNWGGSKIQAGQERIILSGGLSRGIVLVQLGWAELCSVQSTVQSGRVWLRIILSTDQTYKTILSSYTSIIHTYNLLTSWRDPQCEFSWCPCVVWYQMMSRAWCVFEDKCSWCLHYPTTGVRTLNQHTELGLLSLTADNVGTNNHNDRAVDIIACRDLYDDSRILRWDKSIICEHHLIINIRNIWLSFPLITNLYCLHPAQQNPSLLTSNIKEDRRREDCQPGRTKYAVRDVVWPIGLPTLRRADGEIRTTSWRREMKSLPVGSLSGKREGRR